MFVSWNKNSKHFLKDVEIILENKQISSWNFFQINPAEIGKKSLQSGPLEKFHNIDVFIIPRYIILHDISVNKRFELESTTCPQNRFKTVLNQKQFIFFNLIERTTIQQ